MARTIDEIHVQILAEIAANPVLAEADSASITGVLNLVARVVATIIWAHEKFFEKYTIALQALVDSSISGTGIWYAKELKKFQLGDNLVVNPTTARLGYLVINPAKQIIARSSYLEQPGGLLLLKAAKEENGVLVPLNAAEMVQAKGYLARIKFSGSEVNLISEPSDKLRAYIDIYYNSLFDLAVVRANVITAIKGYLANLDFDGFVYESKIEDAIQVIEGIDSVRITQVSGVSSQGVINFDRVYRTRAGYIEPDESEGFTLTDTLNFIAQ